MEKMHDSQSIYHKLHKVQSQIGKLKKDATNPFHKNQYLTLNELLDNLIPLFEEYELFLMQPISSSEVQSIVYDLSSGEVVKSGIPLPNDLNPQHIGSAITYYRRYSLMSLLCLQAEDDDGNQASKVNNTKEHDWRGLEPLQEKEDADKKWLNEGSEDFKRAMVAIQKGYTINELRMIWKISKQIGETLEAYKKEVS